MAPAGELRKWDLIQEGWDELPVPPHPTLPLLLEGSRSSPKLRGCQGGSEGWVGRVGWMIRVHWRSWEGLLPQLGKVEPMAWTQPKPAPAPRRAWGPAKPYRGLQ